MPRRLYDSQGIPLEGPPLPPARAPQPVDPWWAGTSVRKYADFEGMIEDAGGLENAGSQIDALRTGQGQGYLEGLEPDDYSRFDRYVHGAQLDQQNPGFTGSLVKMAALPVAGAYELAKSQPWLLNAASRIPGLETLAVDESSSPASWGNFEALAVGSMRGPGRAIHGLKERILRRLSGASD